MVTYIMKVNNRRSAQPFSITCTSLDQLISELYLINKDSDLELEFVSSFKGV